MGILCSSDLLLLVLNSSLSTTGAEAPNAASGTELMISLPNLTTLLTSIQEAYTAQYECLKNSVVSNSIEELDKPKKVLATIEERTFTPIENEPVANSGMYQPNYEMPKYKIPAYQAPVQPIGFDKSEIDLIRLEVEYKVNYYRSIVGMDSVIINTNMNHYSQNWANTLALDANHLSLNSTLKYSKSDVYGESLFTSYPVKHPGELAVDFAYYEVADVAPSDTTDFRAYRNKKTKRLTQLLWLPTRDIGVGAAVGKDGKYIVVINFNPRGNIEHFMIENIPVFTQDQKSEAKIIRDRIDSRSDELINVLGRRIPTLPGWETRLYKKYPSKGKQDPSKGNQVPSKTPLKKT